jgi:phosphatidylserine decarboxylase
MVSTRTEPASPPISLRWRATLSALRRLPQGALSRAAGWLADRPLPRPLRRPLLGLFARAVGIDVAEAAEPLDAYPSLNAFFVRALRPDARSWPSDERAVASPVDGIVGRVGTLRDGTLLQAKGQPYRASELLGNASESERYEGGLFVTLYLAPRHYHRIHAPAAGRVVWARHVPGGLLPVNPPSVEHVDRLFVRNERLAVGMETASGPLALVAVGAYNVGRISAAFDPAWSGESKGWITNRRDPPPASRGYDPPRPVAVGDELMAFHLGSTVVLLIPRGAFFEDGVHEGGEVRAGSILAWRARDGHLSS